MGTGEYWFDHTGESKLWNSIPLRAAKKAIFSKAGSVYSLAKLIFNGITINFNDTAQGGVVIAPSDYSAIMFVSPDERINYELCSTLTLGDTMDHIIGVLNTNPIPAWDKFATWLGSRNDMLGAASNVIAGCTISDMSGTVSDDINIPVFSEFTNAVQLFEMIRTAIAPAADLSTASFQADTAAFGFVLNITIRMPQDDGTVQTGTIAMGFLFRE